MPEGGRRGDPGDVDRLAAVLKAAQYQHPDYRLGQIIANAVGDPFYVEDANLVARIAASIPAEDFGVSTGRTPDRGFAGVPEKDQAATRLSIEGEGGGEEGRSLRSGGSANELAASQILRTCLGYLYEGGDAKSFASIFQQSAEAYFREFPAGEQLPNEREAPPGSPSGVLGGGEQGAARIGEMREALERIDVLLSTTPRRLTEAEDEVRYIARAAFSLLEAESLPERSDGPDVSPPSAGSGLEERLIEAQERLIDCLGRIQIAPDRAYRKEMQTQAVLARDDVNSLRAAFAAQRPKEPVAGSGLVALEVTDEMVEAAAKALCEHAYSRLDGHFQATDWAKVPLQNRPEWREKARVALAAALAVADLSAPLSVALDDVVEPHEVVAAYVSLRERIKNLAYKCGYGYDGIDRVVREFASPGADDV